MVLKNVADKMNHVEGDAIAAATAAAAAAATRSARSSWCCCYYGLVKSRGRQIDGGGKERRGRTEAKGKERSERKRETNWKSPGKRTS